MKNTFSYKLGLFLISASGLDVVDDVGVAFVDVVLGSEVEIVVTLYGAALGMGVGVVLVVGIATAGGLVVPSWNTLRLTYLALGLEWDSGSSEGGEGGL